MLKMRKMAAGVLATGLFCFANTGPAAAQTDSLVSLDIDAVSEELELSDEARRELAPLLQQLNAVMERRQAHWEEGEEIWNDLDATYDAIARTLSATELREFHWMLLDATAAPWAGRPMYRYNRGRAWGDGYRGRPMMRGRGGFGQRGRGYAGPSRRPRWWPDGP